MTSKLNSLTALVAACGFVTAGCQSASMAQPAVFVSGDDQTVAALKAVLAKAMNEASVELGPGDLTKNTTVSVLPPRPANYEDRSIVTPVVFDIIIKGKDCYAVRRSDGAEFELGGIACRSLDG